MKRGSTGVYFRKGTKEVLCARTEGQAPEGEGWIRVSEETDLGLLKVREILRAGGLVTDARGVYWYGMWGDGTLDESAGRFVRAFKLSSEEARRDAVTHDRGLSSRMGRVVRPLGRGRPDTHAVT